MENRRKLLRKEKKRRLELAGVHDLPENFEELSEEEAKK
jgi:hypothetical protein